MGPLEVRDDRGALLALGKRRQRMLLAALLLRANEMVSVEALIEALWPGSKPAQPVASVHGYVAGLRRVLEQDRRRGAAPSRILTRSRGYLLRVEPAELDLYRFTAAVALGREALEAGDAAAAREHLRGALAEWRGQALADFAYEPFAERVVERLAEQRIDALEHRIRADLACGFTGVVADCESLLAENPLRERLWELLVVALYRSGRQHDALARCQEIRRSLAELGLEPGPELRRVEQAVLEHDPELDSPPAPGSEVRDPLQPELPGWTVPRGGPFVGRSHELAELGTLWKAARDGSTELAVLLGEPGIGKTFTAAHLLAGIDDGLTLAGRCTGEALLPFEPFVEVLGGIVDRAGDADLARLSAERDHLGRLLPLHAARLGLLGRRAVPESEAARYQLFAAVVELLELAAAGLPTALLIDDIQLADDSTLALLQHLLNARNASGLLVVATVRTTDVDDAERLRAVLMALRASGGPRPVELALAGLSAAEVDGYLGDRLAVWSPERSEELRSLTGGNPLFLAEVVAAEQRRTGEERPGSVPGGVRPLIAARLATLPASVQALLEYAAVAGRRLDLVLLATATDRSAADVAAAVDVASAAGLVEETEVGLLFRHDIVREVLIDLITPARRALIHRTIGEAILRRHAGHVGPHLGRLAGHFARAALDGDADRAVEFAQLAGWEAIARSGYHSAVARFRGGMRALDRAGAADDVARVELTAGLVEAERRLGLDSEARRTAFGAISLALRVKASSATLARLAHGAALAAWSPEELEASARLTEDVLARLARRGDEASADFATISARLASLRLTQGDHLRASVLWRRARSVAQECGDPAALVAVLMACSTGLLNEDSLDHRSELARRMVAAAAPTGDPELIADSHGVSRFVALERGDREEARRHAAAYEAVVDELAMPRYLAGRAQRRAMEALLEGRIDDAEEQMAETARLQPDPEFNEGMAAQLLMARVDGGRVGEIAEVVGGAASPASHVAWRAGALLAETERGADEAAGELLTQLLPDLVGADRDWLWLVAHTLAAWSAASLGASEHAGPLLAALRPESGRHVVVNDGLLYLGAVDHHVGALELVAGDAAAARRSLEAALEAHTQMGSRPFQVRSQLWLAGAVEAAGGRGSRTGAARLREAALATAAEINLRDRLVRSLLRLGDAAPAHRRLPDRHLGR